MPSDKSRDKSVSKSSSDKKYKSDFRLTEEKEEYSSSKHKESSSKSKSSSKYSLDVLDTEKKGSSISSSGSKQKNKYDDEPEDRKDSKSKSTGSKNDDYDKELRKRDKDREREKEKERDRDREKERDRHKDKDREREKERDRDREKERDRHKDKDREREKERDREREKERERDRREKDKYRESEHKSSRDKSEREEKYEKSSTSKSKSKKFDSDNEDDVKYKLKDTNVKDEANYNDAYDDDFENDFESDTSEKETRKNKNDSAKNRDSSASYNKKSSKDDSSRRKSYSSDEEHNSKKSSKSKNKSYYDDYDDDDYKNKNKSKTVKANAHIKIPTDLVEVYSSKIYFNHDSVDRQRRRAKDLMKTIELDKKNFSLLDLNPIEMRTVYSSHLKHQKVQTNDDIVELEVQTDEIEESNKWTQYPPDDSKECGSDDKKLNSSDNIETDSDILKKFRFELNLIDLQNFLQRSSKVIETILNEKKLNEMNNDLRVNKTDIEFSKGFLKFTLPKNYGSELTKSAQITNCSFCKDDPTFFVTSFNYSKKESILFNSSILCVWNVNETNVPYRILVCESISTSLCYFSFIVVSGNIDGSVSIWDLRESSHLHHFNSKNKFSSELQSNSMQIRSSTYTTAGVLQNENHMSEIKSIITLQNSIKENKKDVFMQLATLEIDCRLIIWTVVELKNVDLAIFETDLGLLPGGKLKLVKNSQILLNNLIITPFGKIPYQTMCMNASISSVNDFYISTNVGQIIHINRKGSSYSSSLLKSDLQNGMVIVNCVAFHHEMHEIFLAGYGNGEIRLYHKNYMTPIKVWLLSCNGNKIKQIEWLQCRNSAFMVIDESDNLYMWDLLQDDTQCIFSKEIVNLGGLSFCEFKQKEQENNRPPFGLYYRGSKEIEIHFFTPEWSNKNGGDKERKKFNKLIKNYLLIF